MTNGKLPTWFVVKWLSKHEDYRAEAPDTFLLYPCTATTDGIHIGFVTHYPSDDEEGLVSQHQVDAPIRNDWTLYRHDGKMARVKRRTKPRLVGTIDVYIKKRT